MRERYQRDRLRIREIARAKWAADPETARAKQNTYKRANAQRVKEWKRRYYERRGDYVRAKRVADYRRDPETYRQRVLEWQRRNPQLANERNRRHRARKMLASIGDITPSLLAGKLAMWGYVCWMCGDEPTDWDHVKPLAKGGPHMLANLRPACRSCNGRKRDRWPLTMEIIQRR